GQYADAEHSKEPVLISKLESESAEVIPQMENNKESIQTKLETIQEKGKREFSEMDKEKQKMKVQFGKEKGVLIRRRIEKKIHFEKLKKGKVKTPIKNENTRNNWRLAIARRAFIGQDRRIKRTWLRFGKRILGNHRKRRWKPSVFWKDPYILRSCWCQQEIGIPHRRAIFSSKLSQLWGSHNNLLLSGETI
ncbi:hypothetical protein Anas_11368, partial [Armadillidium nasatum]